MITAFRWLIRALVAGMALLAIGIGVVYYLAAGSLPEYDATVEVDGLNGPVEIVRDLHAVPHIFGETDEDVFFGLGYAHAQDRLWQMTMLRRTAQGRLSELFGEATVEIDHLLRALDIYGVAQAMVPNQSPETQSAMRAYAAGVNARLREVQAEALGRGAPEFFLFGAEIAPWTPADSIAVNRIMALQLTDHASRETLRAELSLLLSPERLDDIQPLPPLPPDLERPDFSSLFPEVMPTRDAQPPVAPLFAALNPVHEVGSAGASNAWAAAPSRSASGATVMASDPHLGLSAPSIWMLARLEFPGSGGVIGGTIPGLPGILIGRNADFGWGLTTSYMDDQDVYIERIDPNDPTQYITPTGSQKFRSRDILINVKGAPARQVTLRWTRHGPVIPGDHYRAADITPPGHVAALAWTALDPNDRSMDTLMGLMRARSIAEGRLALRPLISPPQNVIMADREDVALQVMGKMPHRRDTHVGQGRIPVPGWVEENDWLGYLPFDDNPRVLSPDSGMVINTNNRTTDAPFPRHMSFSWGDSQRIGRAQRLLGQREFHTPESFIDAQTDIVSPTARTLLPLIGRDLWWQDGTGPEDRLTPLRKTALERLAEWNGEMSEHRPEPLVYAMWVRALQIRLMRDELGPVADRLDRVEALFIERAFLDIDGAAAWCDVVTSRAVETCQDMAALALDDALDTLSAQYGNRVESWRWGEAHRAFHEHQVLGGIPVLSFFANIVQPTSGGDNTLMRGRTRGEDPDPFTNVHGSALRVIYDFGDPEGSRYIISTGQSGHMLSRHYDDLATLWRRGDYIPMSLDPERARADAIGVTRLVPR